MSPRNAFCDIPSCRLHTFPSIHPTIRFEEKDGGIRAISYHVWKQQTTRGVVRIQICDDCMALFAFVAHVSGCSCGCQNSGPDVATNYHWPACMVGKAQEYVLKIGTLI